MKTSSKRIMYYAPLLFVIVLTLISQNLNAQNPIVYFTFDNSNQNTETGISTDYPAPYTTYYGGQKMQMLILASELSAAGFSNGTQISTIKFPVVSLGSDWGSSITSCEDFQVNIGTTSLTTLTSFQSGLTNVVAPANFTPSVGYNNTHTFSTSFTWNGTSNIIIETTFSNNITGSANKAVTQYNSSTTFQSAIVYRVNGASAATVASATTPTYTYSARPDFKLNGQTITPSSSLLPIIPQNNTLGSGYLYSQQTSSTYQLSNTQNLQDPALITTGGYVGKYLQFQQSGSASAGVSKVQTSINSLVSSLSSFTVEFLVKFSSDFANQRSAALFQFGNITSAFTIADIYRIPDFDFVQSGGPFNFQTTLDGIDRKTIAYYLDGNWHHLAFVVRPEETGELRQQIFIDGLCSNEFTTVLTASGPITSAGNFIFNSGSAKYDDFLGGLDELAIYDRYLTADEVYQHYMDFKNHQHYTDGTSFVTPMAFGTTGVLDPLEFPQGYNIGTESYTAVAEAQDQLKAYPVARFKPGHTLRRNVNYVRSIWMADIYSNANLPMAEQTKISKAISIQRELAENWNYYYNFTENTSSFYAKLNSTNNQVNAAFIDDIKSVTNQYPLAGLLFRKQSDVTVGVLTSCTNIASAAANEQCMIACQDLEEAIPTSPCSYATNSLYPRDANGNTITPSQTSPKSWSPLDSHRSIYLWDAHTAEYNLDKFLNSGTYNLGTAKSRIGMLAENNEIAPKFSGDQPPTGPSHQLMDDIDISTIVGAGDIDDFQSEAKKDIDNDYRDYILNSTQLNLPSGTLFFNYAMDGHDGTRFRYQHLRETNSLVNGNHYSSPDIYPTKPGRWHVDADSDYHGWRWLATARYKEQTDDGYGHQYNDKRFAPFVSPGYQQRSEQDMRPGQYLGLLKAILLQGVDFFFAYSEPNTPVKAGSSFCWKIAPPVYAQAIGSRVEHFLEYGVSLPGTMPLSTTNPTGTAPSYWFNCGDLQKLVTVRQDYDDATNTPLNRFAIVGSMMRYSNAVGSAPINTNATFTLNSQNITIPIRLQGSTYIYDYQNSSNIIFYQLDKWHQYEHPDHWSKDFEFEAEVNDNTSASTDWIIKSEGIVTSGSNVDLTNVTSYIHFNNTLTPVIYNFQPRQDGIANNYALWIRARSSANSGINITLTSSLGTVSNTLNNVNSTTWAWYQVTPGTNTYTSLSDADVIYTLSLAPQNANIEIDAIKLTSPQYAPCPGTVDVSNGTFASQIPNFNFTSASVNIKGTFVVDHDFDFTSCTVYASPGAQITVMPGFTLTLTGSTISSCYRMWRGIKVQGGASINVDNSTISDAQYGIDVDEGSFVNTDNNSFFTNNYIGIYSSKAVLDIRNTLGLNLNINQTTFQTDGSLLAIYPGQTTLPDAPPIGTKCYSGIYLNNLGSTAYINSSLNTNLFSNLYNGIYLINTSGDIQNCKFEDISPAPSSVNRQEGSAIYCSGAEYFNLQQIGLGKSSLTPTFSNCHYGVYSQIGTIVQDNYFTDIKNAAVVSEFAVVREINIRDNRIESDHNGIILDQNEGATAINVSGNDIFIGQNASIAATDNVGIIAANYYNATESEINIEDNNVYLYNNYYAGIHLMNTGDAKLVSNSVQQYNPSYPSLTNPAIKIDNCDFVSVNCNYVNDDPSITSIISNNAGVEVSLSKNSTISCNATHQTGDGFLFHGDCSDMDFRRNHMYEHDRGLHVTYTGIISSNLGIQDHKGNEWRASSYTDWGAVNDNSALAQNSEFDYDLFDDENNVANPQFYPPNTNTVNPTSGWFFSTPNAPEELCYPTPGCQAMRVACSEEEVITEFDAIVANHFIELSEAYSEESRWVAERNLYIKLLHCEGLRADSLMNDFFESFSEFDSQRFFAEVDERLANLYHYDSVTDSLLEANNLLLETLNEQHENLSKLYDDETDVTAKQLLLYQLLGNEQQQNKVNYNLSQIADALEDDREMEAAELAQDNLVASFSEQYELNQQDANNIYLESIESSSHLLSSEEITILEAIAEQCPYSGGPAVYQARALLVSSNGTKSYNDKQICFDNNIAWRKAKETTTNKINVQPNPASNEASFYFSLPRDANAKLHIYNSNGSKINEFAIMENTNQFKLNTKLFINGVYYYKLLTNDCLIGQGKLIIIR